MITTQVDQKLFPIGVDLPTPDGPLTPADGGFVTARSLFDRNSRTKQIVDDNRASKTFVYDGVSRLKREEDDRLDALAENHRLFAYDKSNNLIRHESVEYDSTATSATHYIAHNFYDNLDRLTAAVDNSGLASRFLYDSRGFQVFASDAKGGNVTTPIASLDTHGEHPALPSLLVNGHGNSSIHAFDDAGRLTSTTRFMRVGGVGGGALTLEAGDGRIVTSRGYDLNGRLRSQTDDGGNQTLYDYDVLNRLRRTDFADGTFETLGYDRRGLVKNRLDPNGSAIVQMWDGAGRMQTRTITRAPGVLGTTSESFAYDGAGRVLDAIDNDSHVTRRYDSLGRVLRETLLHGASAPRTTTFKYDGVGNQLECTYPGGRKIARTYDIFNRLETVGDFGSSTSIALYRFAGPRRLESRDYPVNGTRLSLGWDPSQRVSATDHTTIAGGAHLDQRTYTWDRASNKSSRLNVVTGLLHEYSHDSAYRMNASMRSGAATTPQTQAYALDGVGNRSAVSGGLFAGFYAMAPSTDAPVNQYSSTAFDARTYDDAGNLTATLGTRDSSIVYDYRNQMVEYHDQDNAAAHTYAYDALGRRIAKVVNADTFPEETRYYYDGWTVIEERDGSDATIATYVAGGSSNETLTMRRAGQDYFYHADDLGNVMKVTNGAGTVVEAYEYDDYGVPLDPTTLQPAAASSIGNTLLFVGARYDVETGLYHLKRRYLDPRSGRFTSRDPIGIWGDPVNLGNGTSYAGNNPWTYTDTSGLATTGGVDGPCRKPRYEEFLSWLLSANPTKPNTRSGDQLALLFNFPDAPAASDAAIDISDAPPEGMMFSDAPDSEESTGSLNPWDPLRGEQGSWKSISEWAREGAYSGTYLPQRPMAELNPPKSYDDGCGTTWTFDKSGCRVYIPTQAEWAIMQVAGAVQDAAGASVGRGPGRSARRPLKPLSPAPKAAPSTAAHPNAGRAAPNFLVDSAGKTFPVPAGGVGPTPVINDAGVQTGVAFTGGTGGANGQVSTMRVMDPNSSNPTGYIKYENIGQQGVDVYTGQTGSNASTHHSITPP